MAFISTLGPDWDIVSTTIKIENGAGEYLTRLPVGYDDHDNRVFSAFVCLATEPGYGDLRYEIVFSVVDIIDDQDPVFRMDGMETKHLIPNPHDRSRILQALCLATNRLIDEVGPGEVVMSTREANLPVKALAKYGRITSVFANQGYTVDQAVPHNGRHLWTMTKP